MHKSINEIAMFIKELIPVNTLEGYTLNPIIKNIASEESVRDSKAKKRFASRRCRELSRRLAVHL